MTIQADERVRKMVWPSLQADFMLVETYKVELDSDSITVCAVVTVTVPLFRNQRYHCTHV